MFRDNRRNPIIKLEVIEEEEVPNPIPSSGMGVVEWEAVNSLSFPTQWISFQPIVLKNFKSF